MRATIISVLTACALIPHAFAGVFITGPVVGSSAQGGQKMTISWKDDGAAPSLTDIGPCEFGVYAGSQQQQTELQPINPSVDVSKQGSLDFNINPTIGPNSGDYFIRITSLALKDTKNPQFNYEAFSAKFTLSNMSGQFSPAVQAQINGATSAAAGTTSPPTPSSASAPRITTSSAKPTTTSASAAKPTTSNAALMARSNADIFGAVGAATALLALLL